MSEQRRYDLVEEAVGGPPTVGGVVESLPT